MSVFIFKCCGRPGPTQDRWPLAAVALALLALCGNPANADVPARLEQALLFEIEASELPRESRALDALKLVYADRAYAPLWVQKKKTGQSARALSTLLSDAWSEGLDPEDYFATDIERLLGTESTDGLAELELRLSYGVIQFAQDLAAGRVTPHEADRELFVEPERIDQAAVLAQLAGSDDAVRDLRALAPPQPDYARLRQALASLARAMEAGDWAAVPEGATLKPGESSSRVPALRTALVKLGDLAVDVSALGEIFDPVLEEAVKRFQTRHGLTADGVVGQATLTELNVPVLKRIEQVILNMERRRWMADNIGQSRIVIVNLAAFEMGVVEDGSIVHRTNVIVGKTYSRTPVFNDEIEYLELNPYWNVPASIGREVLAKAKDQGADYLINSGYEVFADWAATKPMDPLSVDWTTTTTRYRYRQKPGPNNALGQLKFMFPNRFNVYLHDTPAKQLFSREVRAFSHGCIRVENPQALAAILLDDQDRWTGAAIEQTIATGNRQIVRLSQAVPVSITYLTAWVDPDGTLNFRRDVYGRDDKLADALRAVFPSVN